MSGALLAYVLAALLSVCMGSAPGMAPRGRRAGPSIWLALCALYLLCAANAVLRADVLWVQWARSFAREQHSYEGRRLFQAAALLGLLWLLAALWKRQQQVDSALTLHTLLRVGGCATLVLHLLRFVSFHYTDLALNSRWLGHSLASWVEAGALGLVAAGAALVLLRRHAYV